jgi:hypothetical protein
MPARDNKSWQIPEIPTGVDRISSPDAAELPPNPLNDAFAIHYRVL